MGEPPSFRNSIEMDLYSHFFGEHLRLDDINTFQESSRPSRNFEDGFGMLHVGGSSSSSQLAEDEMLARVLQESENMSAINGSSSNTTAIWDTHVNHNYGEHTSMGGIRGNIDEFIDPDRMTYEELQSLGESSGSVSKGLPTNVLSKLASHKYKSKSKSKSMSMVKSTQDHNECAICKMAYENDDVLTTLPCAHKYHQHCIYTWLKDNKDCCLCKKEVVIS